VTPLELHVTRYGLTTQAMSTQELNRHNAQMLQLEQWLTTPIMLSRPANMTVLAASTWEGYKGETNQFLGYCRKFQGVSQPTLHHFLNGHLVLHYVSFLRARGVQPIGLATSVANAKRVVTYLASTHQLSAACQTKLEGYQAWLGNLSTQLAHNLQSRPPPSLEQLTQQGRWLQPSQLLRHVEQVHKAASNMLPGPSTSSNPTREDAITIMEACLCCGLYGYLPPLRPSILITLQRPGYQGPCLWPNCQLKHSCLGNRLEWEQQPGAAGSSSNSSANLGKLRLVAPHHKTSKTARERQISFTLPNDLQPLFSYHIQAGLGKLWEPFSFEDYDDEVGMELPPTVFISSSTGKPLLPQQVSQVWNKVVLPEGVRFGPQTARAAFCTLVRGHSTATGQPPPFEEDAAAHVMGNSLRMWDMVYDREHKQRAAQAAIDNLAQWRHAVLAAVTPPHSEAALSSLLDSGELTDSDDVEMTLDIAEMTSEDFEAFLRSDSYE